MTHRTRDLTTPLTGTDQDRATEHEHLIARLTEWIEVDWIAELRVSFNPIAFYDAIYECPVVRFTIADESWTAHAHEAQPGQRTWRIRTPAPQLWRDCSGSQLTATMTQLIREYRATIDAPTLFGSDEDMDTER